MNPFANTYERETRSAIVYNIVDAASKPTLERVETVCVSKQSQGQWNSPSLLGGVGHYIT